MAAILHSVASALVGSLASLAKDEFKFLMGVPDEAQRLRDRLERILPVLANADARRLQDEAVDVWVKQLRDVIYDTEDVIEECMSETKKLSLLSLTCFGPIKLLQHKIGNKIIALNQKLDDIVKDLAILNLIPETFDRSNVDSRISRKTSPLVEPDLVGERIEEDVRTLVDMVVSKDKQRRSKISVFAIVGMGGIGKTTLAQKIYNDERLQAEFHTVMPIWVCVSQDFSEIDLLRAIITRVGGDPREAKDKEVLEPMLEQIVKDKRFFLVLDDVWDAQVWEELLYKPFQNSSAGGGVIVTTRHEAVARRMNAVHCHIVEKLSDEDGWLLICKMVLPNNEHVGDLQKRMRDVGMQIVKKCDGLPLALKAIAGVLRNKELRQRHWEEVLQNLSWSFTELHEGVNGVLYLSYTELPSHLKKCFLYFALFPDDSEFHMGSIVYLWIAEGFVETKGNMLMEELAKGYWKELVHRSLLQPKSGWYDLSVCKMHDLLLSFARHLVSNECLCLDMQELSKKSNPFSSCSMRRLNIRSSVKSISDVIPKHASPRTLLVPFLKKISKHDAARLKCLRILSIQLSSIDMLPSSIGALIHLTYLNLCDTAIRTIPKSIGKLVNLQFLLLARCRNLHNIPNSIVNLCNLRCLSLEGTELHNMPIGISRLGNLVNLWGFLVYTNKEGNRGAKHKHCSLEELGSLSQLLNLTINMLENASDRMAARAAALKDKPHLIDLRLHCTMSGSDVEIGKIAEVFEELCPPPCVEYFKIEGYFGCEYPSWMMNVSSSFLPNLRRLDLINCVLTEQLPPLGLLPELDYLVVEGASEVKIIGPELFGVGTNAYPRYSFPKLMVLHFRNMPNWEEWGWLREDENDDQICALLPSLWYLKLEECPKLRLLPERLLCRATALKTLRIEGAHSLIRVENLYYVEELWLRENRCLERVLNLPALKKLKIRRVDDYREMKVMGCFNSLQYVRLFDTKMEFLPEWIEEAKFLRKLKIYGNTKVLSRYLVGSQDWHKIERIAYIDAYHAFEEPDYYIHYTRSPFSFDTNLLPNDDIVSNIGGSSSNTTCNN